MTKNRDTTKKIAYTALFLALYCLSGIFRIPIGTIPISLQILACLLSGLFLGSLGGAVCSLLYVAIGLLGLPVFTGGGGISYVVSPSFGYLIGMVFGAFTVGLLSSKLKRKHLFLKVFLVCILAIFIIYGIGASYYFCILNYYTKTHIKLQTVIVSGCLVFLPTDFIWCFIASLLFVRIRATRLRT